MKKVISYIANFMLIMILFVVGALGFNIFSGILVVLLLIAFGGMICGIVNKITGNNRRK